MRIEILFPIAAIFLCLRPYHSKVVQRFPDRADDSISNVFAGDTRVDIIGSSLRINA